MLRFLTILSFLTFTYTSNAQTYVPFPTSADTAVWYEYYNSKSFGATFYKIYTYGDTIIDRLEYTQLRQGLNISLPGYYYAAIREANKIIYLRNQNTNSDIILFDFNAQVGDTVNWYSELGGSNDIKSIDSVQINGVFRKRFNFYNISIIEGIGSDTGFLPFYAMAEVAKGTFCYYLNGNLIWKIDPFIDCDAYASSFSSTTQINQNSTIKVQPNPTNDILNIEFENTEQRELMVFNQLGQMVLSEISNQMNVVLSLEHLPKGFYVLAIWSENGVLTKKIVRN